MAWLYVLIASGLEIIWALGLKGSAGLTRFWPAVVTVIAMILSYVFLALGVRSLPVGTAYAVWTGIGAAGAAIGGILIFGESQHPLRLACIALIVAGVVGLKALTPA